MRRRSEPTRSTAIAAPAGPTALVWSAGVLAAAILIAFPWTLRAQDKVYEPNEVSSLPKLASAARTAQLFNDSYPARLKSQGIGGMVQLEVVVSPQGKVEPGSIDAVATVAALAEAAKSVADRLEFTPAKVNGTPVRARVVLPVMYRP